MEFYNQRYYWTLDEAVTALKNDLSIYSNLFPTYRGEEDIILVMLQQQPAAVTFIEKHILPLNEHLPSLAKHLGIEDLYLIKRYIRSAYESLQLRREKTREGKVYIESGLPYEQNSNQEFVQGYLWVWSLLEGYFDSYHFKIKIEDFHESLLSDREFLLFLAGIDRHGMLIKSDFGADRELTLKQLKLNGSLFYVISDTEHVNDKEMVLQAMEGNYLILNECSEEMRHDPDIVACRKKLNQGRFLEVVLAKETPFDALNDGAVMRYLEEIGLHWSMRKSDATFLLVEKKGSLTRPPIEFELFKLVHDNLIIVNDQFPKAIEVLFGMLKHYDIKVDFVLGDLEMVSASVLKIAHEFGYKIKPLV